VVEPILVLGIPIDFILFGLTLFGVALFHHHTLAIALAGLAAITAYKLVFTGFKFGIGIAGLGQHIQHEWVILANLFLILMGFALLSRHFEKSGIPDEMPAFLPDDWKGGVALLVVVFVLSSFLDNIAAALIGGTVARHVFRGKVHIGYLAAIVAASNAGGAGSVVGDTTTTMMWIDGVSPLSVFEAYVAAGIALLIFAMPAAVLQQRFSPILKSAHRGLKIDWTRVIIVASILIVALLANVITNLKFPALIGVVPVLGLAVWAVIVLAIPLRTPDWDVMPETFKGTAFLLALVTAASMMPVERLPAASWQATLGLGFVSAVFDNIPLTVLALKQGGYDWGYLAYAVGFGGSMVWFGSSAGVALANMYPEAKSVGLWLRHGWPVAVAYVIGFVVMLSLIGWHPDVGHRSRASDVPPVITAVTSGQLDLD
jgi:Na+/H+ antiporter NhaD/arsenite permease-like protein